MAKATGLSHMTINRIWRAFGLKPHLTETFKLDELEALSIRAAEPDIRRRAIVTMTAGAQLAAGEGTGTGSLPLARRFERIYGESSDPVVKSAVITAVGLLGGTGREHALRWLGPLIVRPPEEQAFPGEAMSAMKTSASLGPAGAALVVRLRDQGLIGDPDVAARALFVTVGGGGA
jgi:hypothetical protein